MRLKIKFQRLNLINKEQSELSSNSKKKMAKVWNRKYSGLKISAALGLTLESLLENAEKFDDNSLTVKTKALKRLTATILSLQRVKKFSHWPILWKKFYYIKSYNKKKIKLNC